MPDRRDEWRELLERAGCSRRVIRHCDTVCDLALGFFVPGIMDREILLTGAMLHDIGRGFTHDLTHAQKGAAYCREQGLPDGIVRIVECHTGAGLTADECTLLRLLPVDCIPRTPEEKVVANADNLVADAHVIGIGERMMRACNLPRKVKRRIFRLWLEMELFRDCA
ncbi:MAG TPA: HDIG domain-containing protein [Methanolinea sp.]|nr:HDIG domain-containing protein [Methanolinea sp.]HPC55158.1 HDIG domain-containing protein [Methanolinea sp.]HQE85193.1 HDIG domain-containing protein [Methanolinea sp.]HQI14262.1 HDIG domain-containing protein [Methanolinea sp.]HQJ18297.1 HDIG domain-containing protein [Methanolinea sp.]